MMLPFVSLSSALQQALKLASSPGASSSDSGTEIQWGLA
jgi:hypothetical protein